MNAFSPPTGECHLHQHQVLYIKTGDDLARSLISLMHSQKKRYKKAGLYLSKKLLYILGANMYILGAIIDILGVNMYMKV